MSPCHNICQIIVHYPKNQIENPKYYFFKAKFLASRLSSLAFARCPFLSFFSFLLIQAIEPLNAKIPCFLKVPPNIMHKVNCSTLTVLFSAHQAIRACTKSNI